jgi:hypothetical protein
LLRIEDFGDSEGFNSGYLNLKNNAELVGSIETKDHLVLILKPLQLLAFGTGQGFSFSMGQNMKWFIGP